MQLRDPAGGDLIEEHALPGDPGVPETEGVHVRAAEEHEPRQLDGAPERVRGSDRGAYGPAVCLGLGEGDVGNETRHLADRVFEGNSALLGFRGDFHRAEDAHVVEPANVSGEGLEIQGLSDR